MNRKKQFLALCAACAILLGMAGGCAAEPSQEIVIYDKEVTRAETEITMFGFKADSLNLVAIETALHGFMDAHDNVEVFYEGIKSTPYWTALEKRADTGNLDDVFMIDHDHVLSMSEQGLLADLSDIPGLDGYLGWARQQFTNGDGSVYFLPTCISTYNLYINYDLLDAYGQSVPTNWAEFQQVCDFFAAQGIVPIIANNFASLPTLITARGLFAVYQRTDAQDVISSFNGDPAALVEQLRPGVELAAEVLSRGWVDADETRSTEQTSDDLALFAQGERPFMISGGWATVRVRDMEPGFSYGVHPYPILDDGSVLSTQVDTCIAVNAASAQLETAKDFVAYLIQPDVMWAYCDSQASYTALQEETRRPSEETLLPSADYLTNGRSALRSDYRVTLPLDSALRDCANALLEGADVDAALDVLLTSLSA